MGLPKIFLPKSLTLFIVCPYFNTTYCPYCVYLIADGYEQRNQNVFTPPLPPQEDRDHCHLA